MSFVAGSIIAKFKSDLSDLQKGIATAKSTISGLGNQASSLQSKFNSSFGSVTSAVGKFGKAISLVGGLVGGISLGALGAQAINTAKDFEQSEIAFTTLLKDRGKALQALSAIQEDAKQTPYNLPELIKVNQMLISAGESADGSRKVIKDLGNAVAATGGGTAELTRLGANLQQIKAIGKASAVDVKQFGMAGINIYGLLAEATGKSVDEVKDMDVSYELLTESLAKASEAGGLFEGAMDNQSKSLQGVMSNIQDTIGLGLKDILMQSGAFDAIKTLAQNFLGWFESAIPKIIAFAKDVGIVMTLIADAFHADWDIGANLDPSTYDKYKTFIDILRVFQKIIAVVFGFISNNKEVIISAIKGIAIALGAIMAVQGVIAIFAGIATAIGFLLSPAGLVIAVITLLYMAWSNNFLGIQDITASVIDFLKGAFEWLMGIPAKISEKWEQFKVMIDGVLKAVGEAFSAFLGVLMTVLQPILDYIMFWVNFWKWMFDNILFPVILLLSAIVARIVVEVYQLFVWLGEQLGNAFKWINEKIIQPALTWMTDRFNELKGTLSGIWNAMLGVARSVWESIKSTLAEKTEGARTRVSEILQGMKDFISNLFDQIWTGIKNMATRIYDAIVEPFIKAKQKIEEVAQAIKDAASKISPFHKNSPSLVELVEKGTGQIAGFYSDLYDSISGQDYHGSVLGMANTQPALAGAGSSGGTPIVNQYITNEVADTVDVDIVNQRLAFMYRNKQR